MSDTLNRFARTLAGDHPVHARFEVLLRGLQSVVPFDAAAILRLDGAHLVPIAFVGLVAETRGRRFSLADEPRFRVALEGEQPVRFPDHSEWHDPYDGLVEADPTATARVHGCMVAPLRTHGVLLGALTLDSIDPRALDAVEPEFIHVVASLVSHALEASEQNRALEERLAYRESVAEVVRRDVSERLGQEFLGMSSAAQRVRAEVAMVARTDLPVLVAGETGTGKEIVARAIHAQSVRAEETMVYLNCAALPEAIAEDELFGHVKGSFTGAERERLGRFEAADRGTLFLDEIGELPLGLQPKLLRALESGEIQRVGSDRTRRVDVRIVAATNRDLAREVEEGRFRSDLYHRLLVFSIVIPPLRERIEDVDVLCGYFLDRARLRLGTGHLRLDAPARRMLREYSWPGNVRELEHVLLRGALCATRGGQRGGAVVVDERCLALPVGDASCPHVEEVELPLGGGSLREATEEFQRRLIARTLEAEAGNWTAAARALDIDRANLRRIATRLGVVATV